MDPRPLERQGLSATGSVELLHARAWSAMARVQTAQGTVYFKAPAPALRFEAALTQALALWRPDCTVPLLAVDLGPGWMLSEDAGVTLHRRLRDMYLEPWTSFESRENVTAAFQIAYRLAMVNRSLLYHRVLGPLPVKYKVENDAIPGWLQDLLDAETNNGDYH